MLLLLSLTSVFICQSGVGIGPKKDVLAVKEIHLLAATKALEQLLPELVNFLALVGHVLRHPVTQTDKGRSEILICVQASAT